MIAFRSPFLRTSHGATVQRVARTINEASSNVAFHCFITNNPVTLRVAHITTATLLALHSHHYPEDLPYLKLVADGLVMLVYDVIQREHDLLMKKHLDEVMAEMNQTPDQRDSIYLDDLPF